MLLAPITVPAKILTIPDTTPSERLLLALHASVADGNYRADTRALGITKAGLIKLEHRLVEKGLLTNVDGRHTVNFPGFVYKQQPEGGYFVPLSKTAKTREKVALSPAKTTPAPDTRPLVVPSELLSIRYLSASAKMLLAVYAAHPGARNGQVLDVLRVSRAGLKKLKRGLIEKLVLVQTEDGYTVRLPGLVLVEGHFISENEARKNGHEVALPAPKFTPASEIFDELQKRAEQLFRIGVSEPGEHLALTTRMIQRVEAESPDTPDRDGILRLMKQCENHLFAMQYVRENRLRCDERKALDQVCNATPEQLSCFREQVEGMRLAGITPMKLLSFFGGDIEQASSTATPPSAFGMATPPPPRAK